MNNSRRRFLRRSAGAGAALMASPLLMAATGSRGNARLAEAAVPFNLNYAPSLGMFPEHAGRDPIDQMKFAYDMGFRAVFDNGLMGRPVADQERIAGELQRRGMELGPFVLYADFSRTSFVLRNDEVKELLTSKMKEGVECARRTGAKWALVVPGRYDERLHRDYQTANVVDNLRLCCDIVEPAGLTIVLEPLNTIRDHPGLFLTGIPQTYQICRSVDRPSCKIVNDMYHQQISKGNILPNIDAAWSEIASFHIGDNPGRREPTTGEMNYRNIFRHIYKKGYKGVLCMEHGRSLPGKEGEARVIAAYREVDSFL
ncbi:MAG: TIM barrel protein [Bacteroidales bacterium]